MATLVPFTLAVTLEPTAFSSRTFGLLNPLIAELLPCAGNPLPPPEGERTSLNLCLTGNTRSS